MQSGFFLDVIITQSTPIFQLFAGKNQPLLIWGDTFLILDLCFDVINGIASFNIQSDGFTGKGFDENLHTTTKTENLLFTKYYIIIDTFFMCKYLHFKPLIATNSSINRN